MPKSADSTITTLKEMWQTLREYITGFNYLHAVTNTTHTITCMIVFQLKIFTKIKVPYLKLYAPKLDR